ncbi:unnamed protein product, partial [Phaeothamnion confervicola]
MAETRLVRIRHGQDSHLVALYIGLAPLELTRLLKAIYRLKGYVVGLQDDENLVLPISLACRSPEMLGSSTYTLLLSEREVLFPPAATEASAASPATVDIPAEAARLRARTVAWAGDRDDEEADEDDGGDNEDNEEEEEEDGDGDDGAGGCTDEAKAAAKASKEVLAFAWYMASQGTLSGEERRAIADLVDACDRVVLAAHAVAAGEGDGQCLAALLRDVARNSLSPAGRALLAAQRELLEVVEVLSDGDVSAGQRAFLEKLVLMRSDLVMAAYQAYQADGDIEELVDSLLLVVRSVGPAAGGSEGDGGGGEDGEEKNEEDNVDDNEEDEDEEAEREDGEEGDDTDEFGSGGFRRIAQRNGGGGSGGGTRPRPLQTLAEAVALADAESSANERAALVSVVAKAAAAGVEHFGLMAPAEADTVCQLAAAGDAVVAGAVEVYREDFNLEDFVDTLARCAKLAERGVVNVGGSTGVGVGVGGIGGGDDELQDGGGGMAATAVADGGSGAVGVGARAAGGGNGGGDIGSGGRAPPPLGLSGLSAAQAMGVAGVEDSWGQAGMPEPMLRIVWTTFHAGVLTKEQACAICDAFVEGSSSAAVGGGIGGVYSRDGGGYGDGASSASAAAVVGSTVAMEIAAAGGEDEEGMAAATAGALAVNVVAAWDAFRLRQDGRDLVDTLVRAVRLEWDCRRGIDAESLAATIAARAEAAAAGGTRDGAFAAGMTTPLSADRSVEVVEAIYRVVGQCAEVLVENRRVAPAEAATLLQASVRGRQVILAALENYESERSLEDLLDTLEVLAKKEAQLRKQ